jgi:anthranilate phosphoribosyltransferase
VPRRELGVRTVFNLLGPLTNPARPRFQLLGVSSPDLLDLMAEAVLKLGVESALVVHSRDGMDEISVSSPTTVREVREGQVRAYEVTPEDFGMAPAEPNAVRGGDPQVNAAILLGVLEGRHGPARDAAVINAAAALYAAGRADSFRAGAQTAQDVLEAGAALTTLERLRKFSQTARASEAAR